MRIAALVVLVLLLGCGRSDMPPDEVPAALTRGDAGGGDAGPPDSGAVDARPWCAPEAGDCLANGWESEKPGHCCLSRQTCKYIGRFRRCFY